MQLLIGNIISLIANILAISSTRVSSYKKAMILQTLDAATSGLANLV